MRSTGTAFCLASGAAFGAMAVFGKLAYGQGATVGTLLTVRFAVAAVVLWMVVLAVGVRRPRRRDVAAGLALGACAYSLQAGGYFAALRRMDAALVSLLVYAFPAIVAVSAAALGTERLDRRRVAALALSSGGLVLVVGGAGAGRLDPLGCALALGAAVVYSGYILAGASVAPRVHPLLLPALVCTGAAASLSAGAAALGELQPRAVTLAGWGWLACLAVVSTVGAIGLFLAGLRRVGPTTASILATVEPVVTVALAFLVFGESPGMIQLAGGALVLAAVPALTVPSRREKTSWRTGWKARWRWSPAAPAAAAAGSRPRSARPAPPST
jgi:drug/metabolite transporter (DMT)-like permease